jgi:hypothetical protein
MELVETSPVCILYPECSQLALPYQAVTKSSVPVTLRVLVKSEMQHRLLFFGHEASTVETVGYLKCS